MRKGVLTSIILLLLIVCGYSQTISSYTPYYALGTYRNQDKPYFVLRRYVQNVRTMYVLLDPESLDVSLVPERKLILRPDSLKGLLKAYPSYAYSKAWLKAKTNSQPLQDAGISHSIPDRHGIVLT